MRHSLRRPFATHLQARNNYNSSVRIEKQTCKDSRGKRDISREQSKCRGYVSRRSSHRHRTVGPMLVHSHHRLHTRPACSTSDLLARRALQSSRPVPTGRRTGVHLEHCRPCRASSQDTDPSEGQQPSSIQDSPLSAAPSKQTNTLIAGGAALVGVALFAFTRLSVGPATLNALQQVSIPYEEALTNGRPTLVEFYADWCSICRSTAPDVYQVEQQQADKLNFVMLNVDNPAWTGEKREYRVSGIPHFVFLDDRGQARGAAIGKLPKQFLADNVARLVSGTRLQGFSKEAPPPSQASPERAAAQQVGPRTHG